MIWLKNKVIFVYRLSLKNNHSSVEEIYLKQASSIIVKRGLLACSSFDQAKLMAWPARTFTTHNLRNL